ncbi:MAG: hypothetical protein ACD_63C00148G0007 [uncultured bacterium]|nr:MAG: hypothetical protein ACD_63C00148G0007 [uncultured bacterium]
MKKPKAHISGCLIGVSSDEQKELLNFYEDIADVCQKHGLQTFVPHMYFFPKGNPEDVYEREIRDISSTDLVVAYVGKPSIGVGTELEAAKTCNALIILLYEKGVKVSKLALGNPAVIHEIEFKDFDDALKKLDDALDKIEI